MRPDSVLWSATAILLLVATPLLAQQQQLTFPVSPEIDPGSIAAALGLLAASALVLRARRRPK